MVLTELRKTENNQAELLVNIDAEAFENAVEKAYRKNKGKLTIPGWRKGKAPRHIVEARYGKDVFFNDAIDDLLQPAFDEALAEADIEFIGRPSVDVLECSKESGLDLKYVVTLRPELTVSSYKGIPAIKHVHTIEEKHIDGEIARMSEKASKLVLVERAAEEGDTVLIDFEGFKDGVAFEGGKGEDYNLTLGSHQFIPGFEEQIVGHSAVEEFDIDVTFPEDYGMKELAGKAVVFHINLKEVRKKEYPELNDEFVTEVSEFDTMEELRADIRKNLENEAEEIANSDIEHQLSTALAKNLEGEVPEVMVEQRIDELAEDFAYRLAQQGLGIKEYLGYVGQDVAKFREGFRENAQNNVTLRLALEAVARAENLTVTDEEIEEEYNKMAETISGEVEKLKAAVSAKEVKGDILVRKALNVVRDNADITVESFTDKDAETTATENASAEEAAE